ncbi:apolipoprotein N-acyltransferase [Roseovarius salinarum]|uniref:apolipoprotein N-acyltransferase n=1 Tax=Roseovarius salinarum TaxID=1981892 RepID=UPI001E5D2A89|nr:apolipoprotein N-acyltransferase [Roseovarius salinarum]
MRAPVRAARWALSRRPAYRLCLSAAAGALAALGQAPLGVWPATLVGFAALFALSRESGHWRTAAALGWAGGAGYFALSLSWIVEPFLVDAARHGWMAPFALVFLSGGLALFWAAAFGLARAVGGGAVAWGGALVLAEAARGRVLTGFPWAQPGHAWIDTPMLQWVSVTGALGLTAITAAGAAALWALLAGQWRAGGTGLAVVAILYATGPLVAPPAGAGPDAPVVRLVQPNAPQHEKWDPAKARGFFDRQIGFTRQPGEGGRPDLIVWPETAIPVPYNHAARTLEAISTAAGGAQVALGIQRRQDRRLYNSLIVLGTNGKVRSLYDKHHLVPFGEYIPFGDVLGQYGLRGLAAQDGHGYSPGPGPQLIGMGDLGRALPLICYEGVFPRDVAAAPGRADFILLVTNDAWFGRVSGPYQHLAQARLRSVEQGLPMVRVANTGVSAVIDAAGRITARLPLGQAGWRDAALPPALPPTPYARMGDWPVPAAALLALLLAGALRRRTAGGKCD